MADINILAEEILNQGKKSVCRELPPFIRAINALEFKLSGNNSNYTNGNVFYYSPEDICKKYKANKNNPPMAPSSSQNMEKIMSFWASGTNPSFCFPFPRPTPKIPPDPIA